jgi:hypothetical protein
MPAEPRRAGGGVTGARSGRSRHASRVWAMGRHRRTHALEFPQQRRYALLSCGGVGKFLHGCFQSAAYPYISPATGKIVRIRPQIPVRRVNPSKSSHHSAQSAMPRMPDDRGLRYTVHTTSYRASTKIDRPLAPHSESAFPRAAQRLVLEICRCKHRKYSLRCSQIKNEQNWPTF